MSDEKTTYNFDGMTYGALVSRLRDLGDEMRRVASKDVVGPEDDKYLAETQDEFDALEARIKAEERKALVERIDVATGRPAKIERAVRAPIKELDDDPAGEPDSVRNAPTIGNPWNEDEIYKWGKSDAQVGAEYRARAFSAIEKAAGSNDTRRQAMTRLIENADNPDRIAKLALRTSHPDYVRAFWKLARANGRPTALTPAETAAVERAMSLTDNAGGYMIPFQLDPTVIITSDGSFNPVRRFARRVIATGDVWHGVSSTEVTWSWDGEAAEVSDDATTFAGPSITVHKAQALVPISIEAFEDAANVTAEVGRILAEGKDTLESAAFTTGDGSNKPTGFIQALAIDSGTSVVTPTTANTFGLPDLYKLDEALPARYRARASWAAHRVLYNDVRQFDTAGGAGLWERLGADVPAQLIGRPAFEVEAMDSTYGSGENYCLVFGDWDNYVIADRVGMSVEFIPHLFATGANRPSGQRGWYAYYRVGADSVNDGAFRVLNIT